MSNENQKLQQAVNILKREMLSDTYGTVSFKMENGNLTHIKIEKTEKFTVS